MTAIAGYWRLAGGICPEKACRDSLAALAPFGPDRQRVVRAGDLCFGHSLKYMVPEDVHERQPIDNQHGRHLFVGDVRIDNREDLASALGIAPGRLAEMSDAALMSAAWERWGFEALERALGDYALSVWEIEKATLTLARAPSSRKPLFYHRSRDRVAFATMPWALHSAGIPRNIDLEGLAQIAAGSPYEDERTAFRGISLVRQGEALELTSAGERRRSLWREISGGFGPRHGEDYAAALRSELDRATAAQLRRHSGVVASQLSSGRDSSAVTAAAALALRPRELIALTGAPRSGFGGPVPAGLVGDESDLARQTASRYDNIRHLICRPAEGAFWELLDRLHQLHFGPILNPAGLPWWMSMNEAARNSSATVLLIGSTGNLSISAGGAAYLPDLWARGGPHSWWRVARNFAGTSAGRWGTVLKSSIGPWLPMPIYRAAMFALRRSTAPGSRAMLKEPLRSKAEERLRADALELRPMKSGYESQRLRLRSRDNAEIFTLAHWGLDVRDPTSDGRLVELSLSMPPSQLLSGDLGRPAFEAAFRDRIPPEVLSSRRRGYQMADWFEVFEPDSIRGAFKRYAGTSAVRSLIDLESVSRVLDAWPRGGWDKPDVIYTYKHELLQTLALSSFLHVHFGS